MKAEMALKTQENDMLNARYTEIKVFVLYLTFVTINQTPIPNFCKNLPLSPMGIITSVPGIWKM